jgi:hypothetical protein
MSTFCRLDTVGAHCADPEHYCWGWTRGYDGESTFDYLGDSDDDADIESEDAPSEDSKLEFLHEAVTRVEQDRTRDIVTRLAFEARQALDAYDRHISMFHARSELDTVSMASSGSSARKITNILHESKHRQNRRVFENHEARQAEVTIIEDKIRRTMKKQRHRHNISWGEVY